MEDGLEEVRRATDMRGSPGTFGDLAYAYVKAGRPEKARGLLRKLLRSSEGGRAHPVAIGGVYAALGEKAKALVWLERAHEEHAGYLSAIGADFVFDELHDEPRFQALLKKMNLA